MSTEINNIVLNDLIFSTKNSLRNNGLNNVPNNVLDTTLNRVLTPVANELVTNTNRTHSSTLNTSSTQRLGVNNPFDLVNNNFTPNQISNNLLTTYPSTRVNTLTQSYSDIVARNVITQLPTLFTQGINKDSIKQGLTNAFSGTINDSLQKITGSYVNGLLGKATNPTSFINGNLISGVASNPTAALGNIALNYASGVIGKFLNVASNFNPNNTENKNKLSNFNYGFYDPTGTYPEEAYSNKSEVNLAAQGEITQQVKDREADRPVVPTAQGGSWQVPPPAFNGKYPYNKVTQTERGHIFEIDDTPGSERLLVLHRNGTYVEINAFGTMVKRTKGSDYTIVDRNGYISIAGKCSVSVGGSASVYVGNNATIEVGGDVDLTCHNDIEAKAGGRLKLSGAEAVDIRGKNVFIEADNALHLKGDSSVFLSAPRVQQGGASFTIGSSNFKAGPYSVTSASSSQASVLGGRKTATEVNIPEYEPPSPKDNLALKVEEADASEDEINDHEKELIRQGIVKEEDLKRPPVEGDSSNTTSNNNNEIENSGFCKGLKDAPESFKLSPNFTLAMLSSKCPCSNDTVVAQKGLTYGTILSNLEETAKNICEPVLNLYPNMLVTSGFRGAGNSISTSQHCLGQAVDIQFRGASKADYFNIAKILSQTLNYDQLLLEFSNYTNNPWIHISFVRGSNRKQIMTFWNNKKHADGLVLLT